MYGFETDLVNGMATTMVRLLVFLAGISLFLLLELWIPYRKPTELKSRRWLINLSLAGLNSLLLSVLFGAAMAVTLVYGMQHRMGLLYAVSMPAWLKILMGVLILDFLLYLWHV
ncbi:MAG: hypothetical protein JW902_01030, partial [Syntrophaceae bacterium]|nr:hypothetical protein [Syntrophaceae bacterium]